MRTLYKLPFAALVALTACSGAPETSAQDEANTEDAITTRTADYKLEPDVRRCVSPLCGGWWVSRLNQAQTQCVNGSYAARCYVASIDWSALGLSPGQLQNLIGEAYRGKVIVRGQITDHRYPNFGNLGELRARRAWQAATDVAASGSFYAVEDLGFVCIAYPCFNHQTTLLNVGTTNTVSGLDLAASGATQDQLDAARAAADAGDLIVAGVIRRDSTARNSGRTLVGSQFYLPVEAVECVAADECTTSVYTRPVRSAADCYCRICPQPISAQDAATNEASWTRFCANRRMVCPLVKCAAPPPVTCTDNVCSYQVE